MNDKKKKITEPSAPGPVSQPGSGETPKPEAVFDLQAPVAPDPPKENEQAPESDRAAQMDQAAEAEQAEVEPAEAEPAEAEPAEAEPAEAEPAEAEPAEVEPAEVEPVEVEPVEVEPVEVEPVGTCEAIEPPPPVSERTPLDIATTLHDMPSFDEDEDDEQERTVETLSIEAFGDESSGSPGASEFDVPTRKADEKYKELIEADIAQAQQTGFDQKHTTVVDENLLADAAGEEPRPVTRGEEFYRDLIEEEISFSKATGYDKEGTAIVPLAELARREEDRLRQSGVEIQDEEDEPPGRSIPVGEIIDVLRAARTVEEVAGVLVEIVSNLIPRVLLLWQRRGQLYGFASRGMELTEVKLLTMEIPVGVMQQMAAAPLDLEAFQGPPNTGGLMGRFFQLLGPIPAEVLIIPIQVTAEDRWLLYADNELSPLPEFELRLLEVVASRAGARADWLLDRQSIW